MTAVLGAWGSLRPPLLALDMAPSLPAVAFGSRIAVCLGVSCLGSFAVALSGHGGSWHPSGPSVAWPGRGGAHAGVFADDSVRGLGGRGGRGPPAHRLPRGPEPPPDGDPGTHREHLAGVRGPRRSALRGRRRNRRHPA